ncbi:MAG: hypothetical protein ABDH29_02295, partial [Aquificaceae bacterium]
FKYECFLSIFSNKPYTLSSAKVVSASTLSRFLSSSDFNPLPLISDTLRKILHTINHDTAFLIADTSLLRKSGRNFQYIKVLYDPSSNTFLPAHRLLVLYLVIDQVTIPIYLQLLFDKKPIDALIQALESLLPWLTN